MGGGKVLEHARTMDDLKAEYRRAVKCCHPDLGGSHEAMVKLNSEYEAMFLRLESEETERAGHRIDDGFRQVVSSILHVPGIEVELVGTWLWVSGDTRPVKEELKAAGFRWSSKRGKWHWNPDGWRHHRPSRDSFAELRSRFGSRKIQGEHLEAIA